MQIEIIVLPAGESRLETKGFSGSSCRDASRFLEATLGKPVREQLTPEFHAQSSSNPLRQHQ